MNNRWQQRVVWALAIGLLLLTHFWALDRLPGFHFDEGWASTFAYRIAFEPGFWPLTAMSPYTSPWTHYWTALCFKILGPTLWVYRFSYLSWSLMGVGLLAAAMVKIGRAQSAWLWVVLVALCPALVSNHHFGIELTSFLTFCFGLFCWGLSQCEKKSSSVLIILSLVMGTTSHILYLAIPGALLLTLLFTESSITRSQRKLIFWTALLLLPFFIRSVFGSSWKTKSYALIVADLCIIAWVGAGAPLFKWFSQNRSRIFILVLALFAIFAFNFAVFFDGSWGFMYQLGALRQNALAGWYVVLFLGLWAYAYRSKSMLRLPAPWRYFLLFLILSLGLLMITPAPRYFEIAFLVMLVLSAELILNLARVNRCLMVVAILGVGALSLGLNYFGAMSYENRDFHFFTLKESSYDFLPKTELLQYLKAEGCVLNEQVVCQDARLFKTLQDLDLLILPELATREEPKRCPWSKLRFERKQNVSQRPPSVMFKEFGESWLWAE